MNNEKILKRYYIAVIKATMAYIFHDEKEIEKQDGRLSNLEKEILKRMEKVDRSGGERRTV